jgi:hypothetical protein
MGVFDFFKRSKPVITETHIETKEVEKVKRIPTFLAAGKPVKESNPVSKRLSEPSIDFKKQFENDDRIPYPLDYQRLRYVSKFDLIRGMRNSIAEGVSKCAGVVKGEDEKAVELCEYIQKKLLSKGFIRNVLQAEEFGYKPLDLVYTEYDQYIASTDFYSIPLESFYYDNEFNMRVLETEDAQEGIIPEPFKLLVPTYDSNSSNPYGYGLLEYARGLVVTMYEIYDFWIYSAERYGEPFIDLTIKSPENGKTEIDEETILKYTKVLHSQIQGGGTTHGEDWEIDVHEIKSPGAVGIYKSLIEDLRNRLMILILGHDGSAQSTSGKLGQEQGAMQATQNRIESSVRFVEKAMNQVFEYNCKINFGENVNIPEFHLESVPTIAELKELAEMHTELKTATGFGYDPKYIAKKFEMQVDNFVVNSNEIESEQEKPKSPDPKPEPEKEDEEEEDGGIENRLKLDDIEKKIMMFYDRKIKASEDDFDPGRQELIDDTIEWLASDEGVNDEVLAIIKPLIEEAAKIDDIKDVDEKRNALEKLGKNFIDLFESTENKEMQERIQKAQMIAFVLAYDENIELKD